jgi:small neutral amino acid transporter SnatA (MarC family)
MTVVSQTTRLTWTLPGGCAFVALATPSIASPGAMMSVVLLTRRDLHTIDEQTVTTAPMLAVVVANYVLMRCGDTITRVIGRRLQYCQPVVR